MSRIDTIVVVGGGLASGKAVETLREEGFEGRLVLVAQERHRPYERPPLSKGFPMGKQELEKAFVHPSSWYDEHDVELRLGARVTAWIGATAGPAPSIEELQRHCRERLAGYKQPREFRFVAALPRTASGKLQRRQLGR